MLLPGVLVGFNVDTVGDFKRERAFSGQGATAACPAEIKHKSKDYKVEKARDYIEELLEKPSVVDLATYQYVKNRRVPELMNEEGLFMIKAMRTTTDFTLFKFSLWTRDPDFSHTTFRENISEVVEVTDFPTTKQSHGSITVDVVALLSQLRDKLDEADEKGPEI